MRREGKQASFVEALVAGGGNRRLEAIERLIDWAAVERLLQPVYAAPTGRASYPVLSLFKAVLLGAWYGLGDPELEAALGDRLSFRRFTGLTLDEPVPDHSTLWRFRDQLRRLGLAQALFAEVNRQLESKGLVVKAGTLVDATLVPAAAAEPPKQKGGGRSAADPDAAWAKRAKGGAHFGYVTKPFKPVELVARVRAQLRRGETGQAENLSIGDVQIDVPAHQVTRDGVP